MNNEEEKFFHKEKRGRKRKQSQESFQPEEAFMKIGFNMRQALKKHPPMGMLENIEEKLNERFSENPNSEVASNYHSTHCIQQAIKSRFTTSTHNKHNFWVVNNFLGWASAVIFDRPTVSL